jgi:hypothetical protein
MNNDLSEIIGAYITGERWMAKDTGQNPPAREAVAQFAYHLYELRGRQDGHDIDDWLRAEDQLARSTVVARQARGKITDPRGNGGSK